MYTSVFSYVGIPYEIPCSVNRPLQAENVFQVFKKAHVLLLKQCLFQDYLKLANCLTPNDLFSKLLVEL